MQAILSGYGLNEHEVDVKPFGTGLINHTWRVSSDKEDLILQKINTSVFRKPEGIAKNIRLISEYLAQHYPDYLFVTPRSTSGNDDMLFVDGEGYFRVFRFIQDSHSIDVVSTPRQAYEAARQFGRFTRLLAGFPAQELAITLPDFHNLSLRYKQFNAALLTGQPGRLDEAKNLVDYLQSQEAIVQRYRAIQEDPNFLIRVTHHDTKISNVLFDNADAGLCVIDLDTVMPGYFISDAGDMMRTYLSPVNEEEKDFSRISIRTEYFRAICEGYLSEMSGELSAAEKQALVFAGKFMIYMQALRFLTDHLLGDVYYGAAYAGHNLVRAGNQVTLLQRLVEKEEELEEIVARL